MFTERPRLILIILIISATAYEGVLFGFALYKTLKSTAVRARKGSKISLYELLLRDNLFYFFG